MVSYPLTFHGETHAHTGVKETWKTTAADHQTECSIPEVYEGSGEAFSPEEFFLLALQNCFVATFKVYADHMKLEYKTLDVSADLLVDIDGGEGPVMKSIELAISLDGITDLSAAETIINKSLRDGFIFNSIKTVVNPSVVYNGRSN